MNKKIPQSSFELLCTICQAVYEKKGYNILTLDVRQVCTMTDYIIIAEGNVSKQLQALANFVLETVEEKFGFKPLHIEGKRENEWVAVDYGECIVHLFTSETREKYAIEHMWEKSVIVDVPIHTQVYSS